MLPYLVPFALYMAFLALAGPLHELSSWCGVAEAMHTFIPLWTYPVKIAVVLLVLRWYWPVYQELHQRLVSNWLEVLLSCGVGLGVYLAWVRMDWPWAMQGQPTGYNPGHAGPYAAVVLGMIRLGGAAVVVPLMEELFWRSFLLRYLVQPQFTTVPLGTFTPLSCVLTIGLFGFEHHLWLAGMLAGAAYNAVLYATRRLWPCVLAHAVTNFLLGIHVLQTQQWQWW